MPKDILEAMKRILWRTQRNRVIDLAEMRLSKPKKFQKYLKEVSEAIADITGGDVQKTLSQYLRTDHVVFGYQGSRALLVATGMSQETFVRIMAGQYRFLHRGGGVYLPDPEDVVAFNEAEAILIAAVGADPQEKRAVLEMGLRMKGCFLLKAAIGRSVEVFCLTGPEREMDANKACVMPSGVLLFEDVISYGANYRVNITEIGPLLKSTN